MVSCRVCAVTGTRAEYGLLRHLFSALDESPQFDLRIIVTGTHLSPEFGCTYTEIESDGFRIDRKVESILSSDSPSAIAKSMGLGLIGMADAIRDLDPDLMLVLGDRFEILAGVVAALFAKVPVAHLHGGEITVGAFDEGIRHAITKMSHLHFVAAEEYRNRVIQLGEDPERVFQVGGLGIDGIARTQLLARNELQQALEWQLGARNVLVTYHPETLGARTPEDEFSQLLAALALLEGDVHVVFTLPNADTGGRAIIRMINEYVREHPKSARAYSSLGQRRYWSLMKESDVVVGNSSSGLLEAPALNTATVDIGTRQKGRLSCPSVIHCGANAAEITRSIRRALEPGFQDICKCVESPYGKPGAVDRILTVLQSTQLGPELVAKRFRDADRK